MGFKFCTDLQKLISANSEASLKMFFIPVWIDIKLILIPSGMSFLSSTIYAFSLPFLFRIHLFLGQVQGQEAFINIFFIGLVFLKSLEVIIYKVILEEVMDLNFVCGIFIITHDGQIGFREVAVKKREIIFTVTLFYIYCTVAIFFQKQ